MRSSDKKRTERDKKLKWDYIDSKVAMFADKVLLEHKDNIERGGESRHDQVIVENRWAEELGYEEESQTK